MMANKVASQRFTLIQTPKDLLRPVSTESKLPLSVALEDESVQEQAPAPMLNLSARNFIRGRPSRAVSRISLPPSLQATPEVSHVFRFVSTGTSAVITVGNILAALGNTCTVANTTVASWAACFRIIAIHTWSAADAGNAGAKLAEVNWQAGSSGQQMDEQKITNIPKGVSVTDCQSFQPPAKSLAGFWIESSQATSNVMALTVAAGTVVDLQVKYRTSNVFTPINTGVSSGVLGSPYYLPLDGSGNTLQAQGLPTTH